MKSTQTEKESHTGIFEIDIKKLHFKKTKDMNYMIFTDSGKPMIKLEKVYLPFGIEYYNKKQILNIEMYPNKNNTHNNLYSLITFLEKEFEEKNINDNQLKNNLTNLDYHCGLKETNMNSVHFRTYMSQNPEIYTYIGKFKENVTQSSVKQRICNIEVELGTLWTNETSYGIIWYVKSIQIL